MVSWIIIVQVYAPVPPFFSIVPIVQTAHDRPKVYIFVHAVA